MARHKWVALLFLCLLFVHTDSPYPGQCPCVVWRSMSNPMASSSLLPISPPLSGLSCVLDTEDTVAGRAWSPEPAGNVRTREAARMRRVCEGRAGGNSGRPSESCHRRTTLSRWRSRTRIPDAHWQPGRPALLSPVHRGRRAAQPRAPAQTSPDAGCRPLGFGPSARVPPSARPRVSWPPAPASGQRGRRGVLVVGSWPPPAGPPPRLPDRKSVV